MKKDQVKLTYKRGTQVGQISDYVVNKLAYEFKALSDNLEKIRSLAALNGGMDADGNEFIEIRITLSKES